MFQGGINTQFGILAIPTVVLFHNTRQVTKFNQTEYLIDKFADFVEATTFLGLLRMISSVGPFGGKKNFEKESVKFFLFL